MSATHSLQQAKKIKTKSFTDVIFEGSIAVNVKQARKELLNILLSLRDATATLSYKGQVTTALPCDFPRLLVEWQRNTKIEAAIKNIVISALLSSEEKCTGSALLAAGLWCHNINASNIKKQKCKYNEMSECLDYVSGRGMTRFAAEAAIQLGALGHRVTYTENVSPVTKVEAFQGKEIRGSIDPYFGDKLGYSFTFENCIVVAIDGAVESVAALHNVLELSCQQPVIVLACSFLPDVTSTMAATVSAQRGVCIPFKIDTWNTENFLDIESCGVVCVSNSRGDTLSAARLEKATPICVNVETDYCTLKSGAQYDRSKIVVSVSSALGGLTGLAKDRIKMLVGYARLSARSGVVRWKDLHTQSSIFSETYSKNLVMPSAALGVASKTKNSLQNVLQELGCVILTTTGEKQ